MISGHLQGGIWGEDEVGGGAGDELFSDESSILLTFSLMFSDRTTSLYLKYITIQISTLERQLCWGHGNEFCKLRR